MEQEPPGFNGKVSPIFSVNRVFYQDRDSPHGHRFMFDSHSLSLILHECGFDRVAHQAYQRGADAHLLIDSSTRAWESLYVEAGLGNKAPAG